MRQFRIYFYILFLQLFFQQCLGYCNSDIHENASLSNPVQHNQLLILNSPRELIVKLNSDATFIQLRRFCRTFGVASVNSIFSPNTPSANHPTLSRIYQITFPIGYSSEELQQKFLEQAFIEAVEMNRLNVFCSEITPNDMRFSEQWNLLAMNTPEAWELERGEPSVVVAVVDSGIQIDHPDLANQLWHNSGEIVSNGIDDDGNGYVDDIIGWDFSDAPTLNGHGDWKVRDNQPNDETGHGTQVSGIIAAESDNGIGITGIAPGCRIMSLRAGFRIGGGSFLQNDDVAAAIVYAADNGADVINLSLGDTVNAFLIRDAVEYAYNRGCLMIAAAGNSSEPFSLYPAALPNVISVAALDRDLQLGGSNFGASIDIAAPGEDILTTDLLGDATSGEDGYGYKSGTSMAAAHVSGVSALLFSANPSCNNGQVRQWLIHTTQQLRIPQLVGAGLIDAYTALTVTDVPIASIAVNPIHQENKLEISGSAGGSGFQQYWIDYGISETPDLWFPILLPQTDPKYNAVLHEWGISTLEKGIYTVRLSVKTENGKTVRDRAVIEILHQLPRIIHHEGSEWFAGNSYGTTVIWQTDVLTTGALEIYEITDREKPLRKAYSDSVNLQHLINITDLRLPAGEYLYQLKSQNRSGLLRTDDNDGQFFNIRISDERIGNTHLSQVVSASQELQAIVSPVDMNGNGKIELIALEANSDTPNIYELNANGELDRIATIDESISLLWGIADIDGDGLLEILANESDKTFLLEQPELGEFPTRIIWEADGIWGGTIADTDLDGRPEIISRHDASNSIRIYESDGNNSYSNVAILDNPTEGKNYLLTRFAVDDFDADGEIEILSGDIDSELFIYENIGDNLYEHTWSGTLNSESPSLFASGDLNGDAIPEFVVGGKVWTTEFDLPRQHWNISIFTSDGDDSYHLESNQRIRELRDGVNGLSIADANNDGMNELCISVSPNFYLIQHDGTSYRPIWHNPSTNTFKPIVVDIDSDGNSELMFNTMNGFTVFRNTNSAVHVEASVDSKQVTPASVPRLVSAIYSPPKQLIVLFDRQMDVSAANASLYILRRIETNSNIEPMDEETNNSGGLNNLFFVPQSAILDRTQKRVVLTFEPDVFVEEYQYELETIGLSDIHGAKVAENERTILVDVQEHSQSGLIVYPNPARGGHITFDRLAADSRIFIYDVGGKLIEALNPSETVHFGNRCQHIWNLEGVSSGVYIYVVESGSGNRIGKVSILR